MIEALQFFTDRERGREWEKGRVGEWEKRRRGEWGSGKR